MRCDVCWSREGLCCCTGVEQDDEGACRPAGASGGFTAASGRGFRRVDDSALREMGRAFMRERYGGEEPDVFGAYDSLVSERIRKVAALDRGGSVVTVTQGRKGSARVAAWELRGRELLLLGELTVGDRTELQSAVLTYAGDYGAIAVLVDEGADIAADDLLADDCPPVLRMGRLLDHIRPDLTGLRPVAVLSTANSTWGVLSLAVWWAKEGTELQLIGETELHGSYVAQRANIIAACRFHGVHALLIDGDSAYNWALADCVTRETKIPALKIGPFLEHTRRSSAAEEEERSNAYLQGLAEEYERGIAECSEHNQSQIREAYERGFRVGRDEGRQDVAANNNGRWQDGWADGWSEARSGARATILAALPPGLRASVERHLDGRDDVP